MNDREDWELGVKNLYVATTANWKMKSAGGRKRTLPHAVGGAGTSSGKVCR